MYKLTMETSYFGRDKEEVIGEYEQAEDAREAMNKVFKLNLDIYNEEHGLKMDAVYAEYQPNGTARAYAHTTRHFDNRIRCYIEIID